MIMKYIKTTINHILQHYISVVVVYTSCKHYYPLKIAVHIHTSLPNMREVWQDHYKGAVWYYHVKSNFMISCDNEIKQITRVNRNNL